MLHTQLDDAAVCGTQILVHRDGDWGAEQRGVPLYERALPAPGAASAQAA
jgi:hypothetical protein